MSGRGGWGLEAMEQVKTKCRGWTITGRHKPGSTQGCWPRRKVEKVQKAPPQKLGGAWPADPVVSDFEPSRR